ncbi:MAG: hypothetical protein WDN49_08030 [Acetobacteraceae bacterium]
MEGRERPRARRWRRSACSRTRKSTWPGRALQLARIDRPDADWLAAQAHLSELARDAVALAADRPEDDPSIRAAPSPG